MSIIIITEGISKMLLCALMVLTLNSGIGQSLHFASSLSELRLDSGSTAYLRCILDGDPRPGESFTWTGPAVDSGRASITLDNSSTVSTLTIESVGRSDEGRYSCSYTDVGTVSIRLNVEFDPHFLNVSEYQEFIEETDAVVECPAFFGDPPGHMIWSRDDRAITDNRFTLENGRMRIQNIQESDEATYRCSINRLGIIDSKYITIAVLERSELAPKIVEPQNPIDVRYGDPLDLTCELEVQRDNVDYTWIVDTDFEDGYVRNTTLTFHRDANHYLGGLYTCRAENEYGYDEQVFFVKILAPPEPAICSESAEKRYIGDTVVLEHCQITSPVQLSELVYRWSKRSANGELVEIRPDGRFYVNHYGFLTIIDIQPSDSGLYLVNISNSQGSALHTVQLLMENSVSTFTIRFKLELIRGSCQDLQEMGGMLLEKLEEAICDNIETCSDKSEIELFNSTVVCYDSKLGTYSIGILSGPSATEIMQQPRNFSLSLDNGIILTLSTCESDRACLATTSNVQHSQLAIALSTSIITVVIIVLTVVIVTISVLMTRGQKKFDGFHNNSAKPNRITNPQFATKQNSSDLSLAEKEIIMGTSANDQIHLAAFTVQSSHRTSIPDYLIISATNIKLADSIGQGEFGIVYKGYIVKDSGQIITDIVAVKTLKGFYDHSTIEELLKECTKMKELNHPNILKLVGVCLDGGPAPFIVTPFMGHGSLLSYLRKNRNTLLLTENDVKPILKQLMGMCLQVAKGMEYLASMKIVHRDLAARNCMIDMNSVIKVADFGLAETLGNKDYFRQDKTIIVKLPFRWLAPESLEDHVFSEKSDVWAYGVTCWEIFSGGKVPYPGVNVSELLWSLKRGQRLDKPENTACSDHMCLFMLQCWELEPKKRPPFSELVQSLSVTLETMADYVPLCKERESAV